MKKIISALALGSLFAPLAALAVENVPTVITTGTELITKINSIGNWMFAILLAIASVMMIYAAFNFITASGDDKKITSARTMLTYSLVGVAVALLSKGLVAAVRSIITG